MATAMPSQGVATEDGRGAIVVIVVNVIASREETGRRIVGSRYAVYVQIYRPVLSVQILIR
jgi:hypothetical protein